MRDLLQLTPRISRYGCGIYEAGNPDRCYLRLFVTDGGFVLPVNGRILDGDDLMEVYAQGRLDEKEYGSKTVPFGGCLADNEDYDQTYAYPVPDHYGDLPDSYDPYMGG